jgi:membrane-bound ClpP family serine protease
MSWADLTAAGAWLIAALLLGIAELMVPGVFLVFIAVAAAIVGSTLLALPDLPLAAQIGAFAAWSVVAVLIGRRWYRDYPVVDDKTRLNDPAGAGGGGRRGCAGGGAVGRCRDLVTSDLIRGNAFRRSRQKRRDPGSSPG